MFEVVICTVNTGRVQRKAFDTWEDARRCADAWSEKGRRVRVGLDRPERVARPVVPLLASHIGRPVRSMAA